MNKKEMQEKILNNIGQMIAKWESGDIESPRNGLTHNQNLRKNNEVQNKHNKIGAK